MAISLKPVGEQVIVITGASSGIGLATAEAAAEQGAKLILASRSGDTLEDVAIRLSKNGAEAMAVDADVGNRADVEQIAVAAIERFGRIDTWVNNAGVAIYGRLDEVSEEDNRRLFDTNFWGVVNGSLVALRYLRANGGAIINVGSEVSDAVIPLQGMYSASKHAVKGFTDALRVEIEEVDKAPVAITLIQPTAVDTPYPEHARNYMANQPKLPVDPIEPTEVAEAILKAAATHTRNIKVGVMAKVNTVVAKVAPAVGEKMAAKMVNRQQRDEPPRDPQGGLHEARGGGRTNGGR
jgi:short-subunit dehydrogenase